MAQRRDVGLAGLTLLLGGLTFANYAASAAVWADGELSCDKVSGCPTKNSCGEPGTPDGCTLDCETPNVTVHCVKDPILP